MCVPWNWAKFLYNLLIMSTRILFHCFHNKLLNFMGVKQHKLIISGIHESQKAMPGRSFTPCIV